MEAALARLRDAKAQRPQRVALAILRAGRVQPAAVEAHEIVEAPARPVEGVVEERRVGGGAGAKGRGIVAQLLQHHRQNQGAGVVVRAIALGEIRHREAGVLKDAGRIAHAIQVVELQVRQLLWLFIQRLDG